jgi:zinc transport system ATP-binding protein
MEKLIEIRDISVSYGMKTVLQNVSFTVWEDDFLGIIGPNGGGKTTLVKTILGLLKPLSGEILFFDGHKRVPSLKIGYLPQINPVDRNFPISVYEVVASGLAGEKALFHDFSPSQKSRINEMIARMEIEPLVNCAIGELSGGQLQRTLLARAVVSRPQLLILDEPNTYVDKNFESRFYDFLSELNKKTAILFISHDVNTLLTMVKNVAYVNQTLHYQCHA